MSKPPVIIVRKDKRINHKFLHAIAFAVTGGASGIVTAAEAANHAQYNARTRKLQEENATETVPVPREQQHGERYAGPDRAAEYKYARELHELRLSYKAGSMSRGEYRERRRQLIRQARKGTE